MVVTVNSPPNSYTYITNIQPYPSQDFLREKFSENYAKEIDEWNGCCAEQLLAISSLDAVELPDGVRVYI